MEKKRKKSGAETALDCQTEVGSRDLNPVLSPTWNTKHPFPVAPYDLCKARADQATGCDLL